MLTPDQLAAALGIQLSLASRWAVPISDACDEFGIDTPARIAAFLAQIGHESGRLRYTREIWGPTPAQLRYEGRADLGNVMPGDGRRFLGRGLIQITGRANYNAAGMALDLPLCEQPELLEQPGNAARSAAWFWSKHGLNELADAGDFERITRRINGGLNGQAERLALYSAATEALAA